MLRSLPPPLVLLPLVLLPLLGCGQSDTEPAPMGETTGAAQEDECAGRIDRFWSDVRAIPTAPLVIPVGLHPVLSADAEPVSGLAPSLQVLETVLRFEGLRMADTSSMSDGSVPVALSQEIDRYLEANPTASGETQVRILADAEVPALVLHGVLSAIGDRLQPRIVVFDPAVANGGNPQGLPSWFATQTSTIEGLEGNARQAALDTASVRLSGGCEALRPVTDALVGNARTNDPSAGERDIPAVLRECGCDVVDLDDLLLFYRSMELTRFGRAGIATIELPGESSEWADRSIGSLFTGL